MRGIEHGVDSFLLAFAEFLVLFVVTVSGLSAQFRHVLIVHFDQVIQQNLAGF